MTSSRSFREVAARIDAAVGHPDRRTFSRAAAEAKAYAELETLMHQVVGPSDLLEFARIDLGEILRKEPGNAASQSLRLVAGNPLIMKQMVEQVPDCSSYTPVTILIDQRPDGVHLSWDRRTSFLAS